MGSRRRRHDQCVHGFADCREGALAAVANRDVVAEETGDRFAEGEGEGDSSVGHTGTVIGDGEGGSEGVKRLADLRRCRHLVTSGVGDTGGAHIERESAFFIGSGRHHERVNAAAAAEASFAAIRHNHLAGIKTSNRFTEGEGEGHRTGGHSGRVIGDGDSGDDGVKRLADLRRRRGLVASRVGDTGGAHIDRDRAFCIGIGRHHERVNTATAAEASFAAIGHRDLAGIETGDRFAEGEREAHSSVGHTGTVIGDGEGGGEGVKRLGDLRRRRGLIARCVDNTGGAHINRDRAFFIGIWRHHKRVNAAAAAEASFAAVGHRDLAGIEAADRFTEGKGERHRTGGHSGRVVGDGDSGEDGVKRLADLRRCRGLVTGGVGDAGGAHIDRDVAFFIGIWRHHKGVNAAAAAEASFAAIRHYHLAGIKTSNRFAEGEGERHRTGGHSGRVVGDGEGGDAGVKQLTDLRRRRGLVARRVGDSGGAHIDRDGALRSRIRCDDQGVNGFADRREASLAAIGHRHLAGIEAGDRFAEGEREGNSSRGHTGTVVGDSQGGRCDDGGVAEEERVAVSIADEEIEIAVAVDIGKGRAGKVADIDNTEGIGAGCFVGGSCGAERGAVAEHIRVASDLADDEIEVAVAVEIGKGRFGV